MNNMDFFLIVMSSNHRNIPMCSRRFYVFMELIIIFYRVSRSLLYPMCLTERPQV